MRCPGVRWVVLVAVAVAGCGSTPSQERVDGAGGDVEDLSVADVDGASSSGDLWMSCGADVDCAPRLPTTTPPGCAVAQCDPTMHTCRFVARDADQDGHAAAVCTAQDGTPITLGDDCDDDKAAVHPGAWDGPPGDGHAASCDGVDNDCSGSADDSRLAGDLGAAACQCITGATRSCATDGKLGTCAGGTETCDGNGAWGACSIQPAAKDDCAPGNDDTCNGVANEGCPCPGRVTPPNYGTTCGSCGGTIGCDGTCTVATPANYGTACGSCGGTIQCNGACSVATPANYGASCGSCGGTVQCNGSCSVPTPANYGQACGSCGGRILCNGSCSIATPGNLFQPCGSCGGKVLCDGSCSIATPANYGASCNSCGGKILCDGSCSTLQPANYGATCNACGGTIQCNTSCAPALPPLYGNGCGCGGTIQCDGTCNKPLPPNYGTVTVASSTQERFSCCYIDYLKWFGGPCDTGYVFDHVEVVKVSGGGACDVMLTGSGASCAVQMRFRNIGTEGAVCNINIYERRDCP